MYVYVRVWNGPVQIMSTFICVDVARILKSIPDML